MKQIGIKLADGSFYPIMEDGSKSLKTLGLTTVSDNQTRVIVDLYRSKTGTMEGAEYIDSIQLDNLNAHANGSLDINLDIGIDENGKLKANMKDPETGNSSDANVTLVNRTLEQRLEPTNYELSDEPPVPDGVDPAYDPTIDENSPDFGKEESSEGKSNAGAVAAGVAAGAAAVAGGIFIAGMMNKDKENQEEAADQSFEDNSFEQPAEQSFEDNSFEQPADQSFEESSFGENPLEETVEPEADPFAEEDPLAGEEISIPVSDEIDNDPLKDYDLPDFENGEFVTNSENETDNFAGSDEIGDLGGGFDSSADENISNDELDLGGESLDFESNDFSTGDDFAADEESSSAGDSLELDGEDIFAGIEEPSFEQTQEENVLKSSADENNSPETQEEKSNAGAIAAGVIGGAAIAGLGTAAYMNSKKNDDETVSDDSFALDNTTLAGDDETAADDSFNLDETLNGDGSGDDPFSLDDSTLNSDQTLASDEFNLDDNGADNSDFDIDQVTGDSSDFNLDDMDGNDQTAVSDDDIFAGIDDPASGDDPFSLDDTTLAGGDETAADDSFNLDETLAGDGSGDDPFSLDDSTLNSDQTLASDELNLDDNGTDNSDFDIDETVVSENEEIVSEQPEEEKKSNAGAIAAGVIGGAALAGLGTAAYLNHKKNQEEEQAQIEENSFASDETVAGDDSFNLDETVASDDGFDLGDDSLTSDDNFGETDSFAQNDDLFADSNDDIFGETDSNALVNDNTPSNGINFNGLYDTETKNGLSSTGADEQIDEQIKKKTKAPVIICIICAIICLLATALILFIIPSKYNLLSKKEKVEKQPEVIQEVIEEPEQEPEIELPVEAKEEEIIVVAEPEKVVPQAPKEPEVKPKNTTYKIKWGDTLWDIADAYYKNPWKYKYIARYNGIKNPDHIISGKTIIIPAQ